jgi:hypothetical protein
MNNVDRHAGATAISIEVCERSVVVGDNGSGFSPTPATTGRGIAESIVGRMERVGATPTSTRPRDAAPPSGCPGRHCCSAGVRGRRAWADHLIERVRIGYGYTLVSLALLILVLMVPFTLAYNVYPALQTGLAALAALAA